MSVRDSVNDARIQHQQSSDLSAVNRDRSRRHLEAFHLIDDDARRRFSPVLGLRMHEQQSGRDVESSFRFADDRSDSGVSSLRSGSGDERSGSRSSALSSSDEPPLNSSINRPSNRSPLFLPSTASGNSFGVYQQHHPTYEGGGSRAWRDPSPLASGDGADRQPHVRHVHSLQHQTLLMSHQSAPASAAPTSAPGLQSAAASLYAQAPPTLMPHAAALTHQHLTPGLYAAAAAAHGHHVAAADMLWKARNAAGGVPAAGPQHLLPGSQQSQHHQEDIMERDIMERARHQEQRLAVIWERQNMEIEKMKEREKERAEREKQEKLEREREEKERQNEALQNHFEKSLRAAQQKRENQWNPITTGRAVQQQRSTSLSEDDRKRVEHERERHIAAARADAKDNRYYANVQRLGMPTKPDYPPPAHSRVVTSKQSEKLPAIHQSSSGPPKGAELFGYPTYHPQNAFAFSHEVSPKSKDGMIHKSSPALISKSPVSSDHRDNITNTGSLMSEIKNSVIVKHDGKNAHLLEPRVSVAHSPSPKLRNEMIGHYMPNTSKANIYEYRSPSQSPHHLQNTHHLEAQNLKSTGHHSRPSSQLSSPHHQRHSPHASSEMRYRSNSESQGMMYPAKGSYQFLTTTVGYSHSMSPSVSNSKPKVSSPAPHQIYGKPSAGIVTGLPPVTRPPPEHNAVQIQLTSKPPPLPASISPSPYQQVSQYHPPPPHIAPQLNCPPPAHSRTTNLDRPYDRIYPGASVPGVKPSTLHGTSPPTATAAPLSVPRMHLQYLPGVTLPSNIPGSIPPSNSVQTQPLDLGISSNKQQQDQQRQSPESPASPKRRGTPVSQFDAKKRRVDSPSSAQYSLVREATPLVTSAIPTTVTLTYGANGNVQPAVENLVLPELSVTAVTNNSVGITEENIIRPASAELSQSSMPPKDGTPTPAESPAPPGVNNSTTGVANSASNLPTSRTESPTTPIKSSIGQSSVDSEKSNSPGPTKSNNWNANYRHLKKAWLQRHTGEDIDMDTTGIVGSGTCVTLPINIVNNRSESSVPSSKETSSIGSRTNSIGSMAVNSISKPGKHLSGKSQNGSETTNRKKEGSLNGHPQVDLKNDDSSSSDPERGRKSPPKRKPPKVKKKKGPGVHKKVVEEKKRKSSTPTLAPSESGSDSDKETGSEKDSDSGASTTVTSAGAKKKEPRKRGRRPKTSTSSKNDKGEEPRPKKSKDDKEFTYIQLPHRDLIRRPPVGQLKKTGESFLQDGPCFEVAPKLAKCRECRWTPNQRSKNIPNIFCRFYAFRRLRYTKNGQLAIHGFSEPHKDPLENDIKIWLPNIECPPADLDLEQSRFILKQVGDHFCDLLIQEKDAMAEHMSDEKIVAWKRVVQGVREMCDVCETTLFNFHWACGKCGFVVCLDCYKGRKNGNVKIWGESGKDRDEFSWLLCTNRQAHEQEKLMLTQIIADDCLIKLGKMVHESRELWNIEQFCNCLLSKEAKANNITGRDIVKKILSEKLNGVKKELEDNADNKPLSNGLNSEEDKSSPLSWLADVAIKDADRKNKDETSSDDDDNNYSTLRELLIRPSHKQNGSRATSPTNSLKSASGKKTSSSKIDNIDDVLSSVIEENSNHAEDSVKEDKCELKHFVRRYNWQTKGRSGLPIRIMTLTESKMLYPNVPHSWLCDGKLLRLSDPAHKDNYKIFQDQWKRGQPVIVSDVTRVLSKDLWTPESFVQDFGEDKNDLINCMTGNLVPNQPMKKFWEGFDNFSKRLKDDRGNPMLLKLKDWPPGDDFAEMLPSRYNDLMQALPLSEYTHRNGRLNLASRLPECIVRPDLGPKMYNAYGSALHPSKGTTNLHLDISDAVNVMVYVGIPKDSDSEEHIKEAFRAIDEAGCDILTRRRVRDKGELPGALWHIYNARDADKIRDLLNKVVVEKGGRLEPHHDPIHDQSSYLDGPLRERLYKEYGVEGYAIVQCLGDAVFIPAGAPHQVRNLHNCIKVAEDFVSPENVSHCFHLTQEFRHLSDTHSNHEDKLQIKNIIYHAVKDSISTLQSTLNKHLVKKEIKDEDDNSESQEGGNSSSSGSTSAGGVDKSQDSANGDA